MNLEEFLSWAQTVFDNEGLAGWQVVTDRCDAYCWHSTKTITLKPWQCYPSLFLHEVAHALAPEPETVAVQFPGLLFEWFGFRWVLTRLGGQQYHGGRWADRYGYLLQKYMVEKTSLTNSIEGVEEAEVVDVGGGQGEGPKK